jgi:hypothetical protein
MFTRSFLLLEDKLLLSDQLPATCHMPRNLAYKTMAIKDAERNNGFHFLNI